MKDAEFNEQRNRIRKLVQTYHHALGFNWFRVDHNYEREVNEDSPQTAAKTSVSWEYLDASVTWYLPVIANQDDDRLREIFMHEYAHILTGGLMAQVPDNDEAHQVMEYTASIVGRALEYAVDFTPKKPKNVKKPQKTIKTAQK